MHERRIRYRLLKDIDGSFDALLYWVHAEEALFSFEELEREANSRGFRAVKKAIDLGMEGCIRFQKP